MRSLCGRWTICGTVAVLTAVLLGSCGVPIRRNQPSDQPWTNYEIGRVQESSTGATMVEWIGKASLLRGYRMVAPVKVERIGRQPPSSAGAWAARFTYHGTCGHGRYVITTPTFYKEKIGIIVTENGEIPCDKSVIQIRGLRRGRSWHTPESIGTRAFLPEPVVVDVRQAPIKWELIYSGRSGDEVALAYREYMSLQGGTFARPDFYQDLKYDLRVSRHVVFRSTEIEILEASNAGVKFRVLRDAARSLPTSTLAPRE